MITNLQFVDSEKLGRHIGLLGGGGNRMDFMGGLGAGMRGSGWKGHGR